MDRDRGLEGERLPVLNGGPREGPTVGGRGRSGGFGPFRKDSDDETPGRGGRTPPVRRTTGRASRGSVANSNHTSQRISNGQTALHIGAGASTVAQLGANTNNNTNTQFGVPLNLQG